MKDFPLNELLSATDVEKIRESLGLIFGHLNKKLKLSYVYLDTIIKISVVANIIIDHTPFVAPFLWLRPFRVISMISF